MRRSDPGAGYEPPRYRAADDAPWYHALHGNVPDHQIDFMYGPEVPQGSLTPTHYSHLARLMKYIEPQTSGTHAFAIGNLSRDDTQHEAGHGAIALIFAFRIGGATDHAGRGHPPFAHGIIAIDREVRRASLLEAVTTFHRHATGGGETGSSADTFYRAYVRAVLERPDSVCGVLSRYVEEFGDLPRLPRSDLPCAWVADAGAQPRRVVIVHGDGATFGSIASVACRLAAVLYCSNLRWTAISTGREADIPGGLSVRIVPERELAAEDLKGRLLRIEEVPEDEAEIARAVLGARPHGAEAEMRRAVGWRERYAAQRAPAARAGAGAGAERPGAAEASEGEARASEGEARASEGEARASGGDARAAPSETRAAPSEARAAPSEAPTAAATRGGAHAEAAEAGEAGPRRAAPDARRARGRGAALGAGVTLAAVAAVIGAMSGPAREDRTADSEAPRAPSMASPPAPPPPAQEVHSGPEPPPAPAEAARAARTAAPRRAPARRTPRRSPATRDTSEPTVFDSAPMFE
ncbi:hypothetical protein WMF30_35515 [Sorangium sp. So ce134]